MKVVKQIKRCGIFESERSMLISLSILIVSASTALAVALAIFNLANSSSVQVLTRSQLETAERQVDGMMEDLLELRKNLTSTMDGSSAEQESFAAGLLELEALLQGLRDQMREAGGISEETSAPTVDGDGVEGSTQLSPPPTVPPTTVEDSLLAVHLYANCSLERLTACTSSKVPSLQNVTFSHCLSIYTRGSHRLDVPGTHLHGVFCSPRNLGRAPRNSTNPISASLRYEMDDVEGEGEKWTCICSSYEIQGAEFANFECEMFGRFCPNRLSLPL